MNEIKPDQKLQIQHSLQLRQGVYKGGMKHCLKRFKEFWEVY